MALQDRGKLITKPGDDVYEGMICGICNKDKDMVVNMTKAKQLTNFRASGTDDSLVLIPPVKFTLEEAIDFIERFDDDNSREGRVCPIEFEVELELYQ